VPIDTAIYEKLTGYCAYQERCTSDVRNKLYALKADADEYENYIARLENENFLNEDRYTKFFIRAYSRKKWGKVKIKNALLRKGIPAPMIKKYLEDINDEDYEQQIAVLIEKKWKSIRTGTPKERKLKLLRYMLSKGFEMNKITALIKNITS
jgi:regulatory protein